MMIARHLLRLNMMKTAGLEIDPNPLAKPIEECMTFSFNEMNQNNDNVLLLALIVKEKVCLLIYVVNINIIVPMGALFKIPLISLNFR